jgi:hypothetical protein
MPFSMQSQPNLREQFQSNKIVSQSCRCPFKQPPKVSLTDQFWSLYTVSAFSDFSLTLCTVFFWKIKWRGGACSVRTLHLSSVRSHSPHGADVWKRSSVPPVPRQSVSGRAREHTQYKHLTITLIAAAAHPYSM